MKTWLTVVPLPPVTVCAAEPSPQFTPKVYEPVELPPVRVYVTVWPGTASAGPEMEAAAGGLLAEPVPAVPAAAVSVWSAGPSPQVIRKAYWVVRGAPATEAPSW